ncbi:Putative T-box protein 41 [Caenorhabditis elegans]|nr:Putative T-box protein 41 [Caenorhabditis elegans]CCD64525.2 Putative T-box protein 41 [Caenorhabditis elegans]|eukprot:NP_508343.2 Putative T-box protein 41 [Caenorhabditis elegans]
MIHLPPHCKFTPILDVYEVVLDHMQQPATMHRVSSCRLPYTFMTVTMYKNREARVLKLGMNPHARHFLKNNTNKNHLDTASLIPPIPSVQPLPLFPLPQNSMSYTFSYDTYPSNIHVAPIQLPFPFPAVLSTLASSLQLCRDGDPEEIDEEIDIMN